jgi:HlyD family secretion protein
VWHQRRIAELQALVAQGSANLEQTNLLAQEKQALGESQASLARVQASRDLALKAAAAATARAEATLEDARETLATAQAGGDKLALAKAQVALQDAQVALAVAQDNRDTLKQGTDAVTLAAAQADTDKKRLALADAEADLAAATLTAPFDGTVLRTRVAEGALIGAATTILTVANMKTMQVIANVDETTIRRVSAGQNATITFDALPGQTVRGKVASVPLQGALQGNVMVYEVPIALSGADALPLLSGMTANVQIQTGQAANALLVPAIAVKQAGNTYQVLKQNSDPAGQPITTTVEIGLSDGVNTQVTSGLTLDDKVIVQYQASTSSSQNQSSGNIITQLLGRGAEIRVGR